MARPDVFGGAQSQKCERFDLLLPIVSFMLGTRNL